jgi:hypothetical protein
MARFIAEFGGKYCEWSTIVDGPTTHLMSEAELREFIADRYGDAGLELLPEQMERVRKTGCSLRKWEKKDLLGFNRAGPDESHLRTEADIVKHFTFPTPGDSA